MANVGEQLLQPEEGWKRYDDFHLLINNAEYSSYAHSSAYGGSYSHNPNANQPISFSFSGDKIRLIVAQLSNSNYYTKAAELVIDGEVKSEFSIYGPNQYQTLIAEVTNLGDGIHLAIVRVKSGSTGGLNIDAIDIESNERILHPDEVTDPKDLEVGKRIRCHYQASANQVGVFSGLGEETSDLIPPVSSATPNGDFYFIMVEDWNGKKRLIADRNIQHNISWDKLNAAGVASGSGSIMRYVSKINSIPLLTSNISAVTSNGRVEDGFKAFDRELDTYWTANMISGAWLQYEYDKPTQILAYCVGSATGTTTKFPRSWRFEAFDEVSNKWITLDTQSDISWSNNELKKFSVGESGNYKKYRIFVLSVQAGQSAYTSIGTFEMYPVDDELFNRFNLNTRLLTGGISASDKDNEWDKYIVGGLHPSDDSVWNAIVSSASWTSTTPTSYNNRRVTRGGSVSVEQWLDTSASSTNTSNNALGFRPVLEIEELASPIQNKYLFQDGEEIKALINNTWTLVGSAPATKEMSEEYGMNLSVITNEAIQQLESDSPKLLCWTDEEGEFVSRKMNLIAIPFPQLLLPARDIGVEALENVLLNSKLSGTGHLKVIVSGDSGVSWRGLSDVSLDPANLPEVKTNGFTPDKFNALTEEELMVLFPNEKIRIAFYLEQESLIDIAQIISVSVNEIEYKVSPSLKDMSVFYEALVADKPSFYVSRNDGEEWIKIEVDELTKLDSLPEGEDLRVKAVLQNGQELHGISYSWI